MELTNANTIFGLPAYNEVSEEIQQAHNDSCVLKSTEILLNSLGINTTEEELRNEAIEHNWYTPGYGTPISDVGKLIELHGLEVKQNVHSSMYNLVSELEKNHSVIVCVDSGELWRPGPDETFEDFIYGQNADHALLVGGIQFNDDFTGGAVNLIDPGTGDFCKSYPLDQFNDAWNDSNNFMLTIS